MPMPSPENRFVDVCLTLSAADADRLEQLGAAYISPSYAVHLALRVFDAVYHGPKELYDAYLAHEIGRGLAAAEQGDFAAEQDVGELLDGLRRRSERPVAIAEERDLRSPKRCLEAKNRPEGQGT